jgi:radical SAM protein with 4Fe4S-binding SPASM domain
MYRLERYVGSNPRKLGRALESSDPIRPLSVKMKLTWHCNLACVMCAEWRIQGKKPPRPNYFDTWEKLEAVLADLVALKAKKVHFSGGEPLMHPHLERATRYLSERGLHVTLVSNGTLWTPERAMALLDAGLSQITISIDSPQADTYARLRGKHSWTLLQRGVAAIRQAIDASGRQVLLKSNTVVTCHNFRELVDYPALAQAWGIDRVRLLPVDDLHVEKGERLRLNRNQIAEYQQHILPFLAAALIPAGRTTAAGIAIFGTTLPAWEAAEQGHYARGFYDHHPCFAPWLHSLIGADGRVHACCMLKGEKHSIDQISSHQGFAAIWNGERYRQFRAQMRASRPPICGHCDDYLAENRYLNQLHQLATPLEMAQWPPL